MQRAILLSACLFVFLWALSYFYVSSMPNSPFPLNYLAYHFAKYSGDSIYNLPLYFRRSAFPVFVFLCICFALTVREQLLFAAVSLLKKVKKFHKAAIFLLCKRESPELRVGSPFLFLIAIFAIALLFRMPSLGVRYSWDPAFILYFSKGVMENYPHVPEWLDGYYLGDWFEYPPLFPFALATICKLELYHLSCVDTGRLFVALLSAIAVFPVFLLGRQLFGSNDISLAGAFLYAITPSGFLADEWPVSLSMLFFVSALYFYLKANPETRWFVAFSGFAGGLLALTHQLEFFVLVILVSVEPITSLCSGKNARAFAIKKFFGFLFISLAISSVWYAPIIAREGLPFFQFQQFRVDFDVLSRNNLQYLVQVGPEELWHVSFIFVLSVFGLYHAGIKRYPEAFFWLVFSIVMVLSGNLGFYFINSGQHYLVYLSLFSAILGGFGITALARNFALAGSRAGFSRRRLFFCFPLFLAFSGLINLFFFGAAYAGEDSITPSDVQAYFWMRQNLPPSAHIMSDYPHSFWFPYLSGMRAVTGRKLSEPRENRLETLTATVFATGDPAQALRILQDLSVDYVYVSNHTAENFPILGDEDTFGKKPAVLVWKTASTGLGKFESDCFRRIYFHNGDEDTISIYEPRFCEG